MLDVEKLIDGVHDYIGRALAPFALRVKALEDRAPERGEKGEPGESIRGERGEKGDTGPAGERGADGANGKDGKSAYQLAIARSLTGVIPTEQQWLESLNGKPGENGRDGINGKDAVVDYDRIGEAIKEVVAVAVDELPKPKDGKDGASIHPDTVALMVRNAVDAAVATMPAPVTLGDDRGSDDIAEMAKAFIAGLTSEESRV